MKERKNLIAWKLETSDPSQASVRYRALIPALHLEKFGFESHFYHSKNRINFEQGYSAIIFVKSFSEHDWKIAQEAARRRIPIHLDICDNMFEGDRPNVVRFADIAKLAETVVVTTKQLSIFIQSRFHLNDKIRIIEDTFETSESITYSIEKLKRQRHWYYLANGPRWFFRELLRIFGRRFPGPAQQERVATVAPKDSLSEKPIVLWYGRGGVAGRWGMTDLKMIQQPLEAVYQRIPFQLVVNSDNRELFQKEIAPMKVETHFIQWSINNSHEVLKRATLVVVPNPLSDFTVHKSPNRTIQALAAGIPVVATMTEALRPFQDCVAFDNFEVSIAAYLSSPSLRAAHLALAQKHLAKHSPEHSASRWTELLRF